MTIEEKERMEQAHEMVVMICAFDCDRKPGEFIKRYGNKFSRLNELRPHHFDHNDIPKFKPTKESKLWKCTK